MKRPSRGLTTVALALLASSANMSARATAVRQKPGALVSQRTAADGRLSLRDGAVVTRVIDAGSGAPISGARVGETRTSFTISASGYRPLEIALSHDAVARGDRHTLELPAIAMCQLGASDKDGDGLCDAAERQYRSDPASADTDGDSISDNVEMYGEKLTDGTMFDLKREGATPNHKDVFVRMDWTNGYKPSQDAADLVVKAFANAPLKQLDGTMGIRLHLIFGAEIKLAKELQLTSKAFQDARNANFKQVWSFPFHYAIFTDWVQGHDASGYSPDIPGTNFAVAVLGIGTLTPRRVGGTLMHELGHNLGLLHGGNQWKNNKPNYISVMNYLYTFDGIQYESGDRAKREIDYARFPTIAIHEASLDERKGFLPTATGGAAPDRTVYDPSINICPRGSRRQDCTRAMRGQVPGAIDFNGRNGPNDARVARDLNGNLLLEPFWAGINDWEALEFHGIPNPKNTSRVVSDDENDDPTCPLPSDDSGVPKDDDPSLDPSTSTESTPSTSPGEELPTGTEQPVGEPPGSEQPVGEPGSEVPPGEQPGDERPGEQEPWSEVPGDERPGEQEPWSEVPGDERPGEQEPWSEVPSNQEPGPGTDDSRTDEPADEVPEF